MKMWFRVLAVFVLRFGFTLGAESKGNADVEGFDARNALLGTRPQIWLFGDSITVMKWLRAAYCFAMPKFDPFLV